MDKQQIYFKLLQLFPATTGNIYDEYENISAAIDVLHDAISYFETKADDMLMSIIDDNIQDDTREVIFKADTKRYVDIEKLRENEELFEQLAYVKDSDVVSILGRSKLREMVTNRLAENNNDYSINSYITANITELEKKLGKKDAEEYINSKITRNGTPLIVPKNSYPKDYFRLGEDKPITVFMSDSKGEIPKSNSKLKI